jgi:CHAT domain-containing protein
MRRRLLCVTGLILLCACGAADRADVTHAAADAGGAVAPGEALYRLGEFDSARVVWRAALTEPAVQGTADEARLHTWLALAAWRLGDYAEARELGEAGLRLAAQMELTAEQTQAHNTLGLLAWSEGRLTDAAMLFEDALAGFSAAGDRPGITRANSNLGMVRFELGRFDEARSALSAARDLARSLGEPRVEGRVLSNLGMLEIWTGDPLAALEILRDATARALAADDAVGLNAALGQTGVARMVLGERGAALAALDSALAVARRGGLRHEAANDLLVLAGIHADAGDTEQALRFYAEARQLNEELGLAIEAGTVLREEAVLRAARGAGAAARVAVLRALALHRDAGARREELLDLLVLADIDRREQGTAAAAPWIEEARPVVAELGSPQARLLLGTASARNAREAGDATAALRTLAALEPDLAWGGAPAVAEVEAIRLGAWSDLGSLDSAAVAGRRAVAALETVRSGFATRRLRSSYLADRSRVYADVVLVLLRQGRADEAFAVADAARGRAILEHIAAARRNLDHSPVGELAEAERLLRQIDQLLSLLASEESRPPQERSPAHAAASDELLRGIEGARSEYTALLVRAAEREPQRAQLLGARAVSTPDVRAALLPHEAVLELMPSADRLFIFVVTRDSVHVITRGTDQASLVHRVQLARELLTLPEAGGRERAVTEALHDLLIPGGNPVLSGVTHLYIVAHGALAYLPFATLRNPSTGRLLADDYVLSHLPAAAALPLLRSSDNAYGLETRGAVFAPFPQRLPFTASEAQTVGRMLTRSRIRKGNAATEAALRRDLASGQVVHVATHGVMNSRNPLFSRIELAPGRGRSSADDGRLEVHELLVMRISAPLVFLSGCQTALGSAWATSFDQGDDYATLAQAFLLAGAGNVIATLWRIDDAGAAAFAGRFYHHLRQLDPPAALAAAQRDLRNDARWQSPYYWAGYVLHGVQPAAAQNRTAAAVSH